MTQIPAEVCFQTGGMPDRGRLFCRRFDTAIFCVCSAELRKNIRRLDVLIFYKQGPVVPHHVIQNLYS